jgi:hypothetical protein
MFQSSESAAAPENQIDRFTPRRKRTAYMPPSRSRNRRCGLPHTARTRLFVDRADGHQRETRSDHPEIVSRGRESPLAHVARPHPERSHRCPMRQRMLESTRGAPSLPTILFIAQDGHARPANTCAIPSADPSSSTTTLAHCCRARIVHIGLRKFQRMIQWIGRRSRHLVFYCHPSEFVLARDQ